MGRRIVTGFLAGLLATLIMTGLMLLGSASGLSPIPRPIPIALAAWAFGAIPPPALMVAGMGAHFLYGGLAGALFVALLRARAGIWSGLAWGLVLWLGMGLLWLPLLGWGAFGSAIAPRIAVATAVLHLVYGGVLGWAVTRGMARSADSDAARAA